MRQYNIICKITTQHCNVFVNALPGNSSVNTVLHATTDEAVFSMSSAPRWKVFKSETAPYLNVIKRTCNQGANKYSHPN
jgi:hypothetical protein